MTYELNAYHYKIAECNPPELLQSLSENLPMVSKAKNQITTYILKRGNAPAVEEEPEEEEEEKKVCYSSFVVSYSISL